jgi:hypothetical protein
MKQPTLLDIRRSQKEYLDLLLLYKDRVQADDLSVVEICGLLDEVKSFWLKKLKAIEFELEELRENRTCFLLSGAIFLNVTEHEHYYFKSLGDCHIISDPFSRFEMIFRHPEEKINSAFTIDHFREAFLDTLEVLTTYKEYFYILPIQEIAIEDSEQHLKLIDGFFWRFISSVFNDEFDDYEDFYEKYKSFEEIEAGLNSNIRESLVFTDLRDRELTLRERVEKFNDLHKNLSSAITFETDAQRFILAVYSYIAQVADILSVCSALGINPYIRFDITFIYFSIVMRTFTEDVNLRRMIEKTIVAYVFYRTVDESIFKNIPFTDYCIQLKQKPLLDSILERMHAQEINIFTDDTSKIVKIIEEEYEALVKKPRSTDQFIGRRRD